MEHREGIPESEARHLATRVPTTLRLSDRDLWLVHSALQAYLASFSHSEGELEHEVKDLIRRLQIWMRPGAAANDVTLPDAEELTL